MKINSLLRHKRKIVMNVKSLQIIYLFFLVILLVSCDPIDRINIPSGGVAITFDDAYIDEWYNVHNILKKYNWRATFFVSQFHKLDSCQIEKLRVLKEYGHEIGGHGLNHFRANDYVQDNGIDAYLENEIYPMKEIMAKNGFNITSFAYPQGARNNKSDIELLKEFKVIRAGTRRHWKTSIRRRIEMIRCRSCFPNLLYGIGIDNNYEIDMPNIKSLMENARNKNTVVLFLTHKPVEVVDGNYQIEYQRLIEICEYINKNNMRFMLISDLYEK